MGGVWGKVWEVCERADKESSKKRCSGRSWSEWEDVAEEEWEKGRESEASEWVREEAEAEEEEEWKKKSLEDKEEVWEEIDCGMKMIKIENRNTKIYKFNFLDEEANLQER